MEKETGTFNIIFGKNVDSGTIIDQALIDLLIEKGVFTPEEIQARVEGIRREVAKRDPIGRSF